MVLLEEAMTPPPAGSAEGGPAKLKISTAVGNGPTGRPAGGGVSLTIRDLPLSERPRERLQRLGVSALSQQELLACVLGRGVAGESVLVTAQRLLQQFESLHGIASASLEELAQVHGVGPAKAAQLTAAFALSREGTQPPATSGQPITDAHSAFVILAPLLRGQPTERVVALLLDTKHRLIRSAPITTGSVNASLIHPREVFHEAVRARATAVILAHNHPSGDPAPSEEDIALTEQLAAAGRLVGIPLLDHIIIGGERHVSLAQEGYVAA